MVYTFQVKVFVKKERTVGKQGASHIPTSSSLQKFPDHLDMSCTPEIAALLPSTAQRGGHTVPSHPDQEAPIVTAPQHRGPTAPPQPEQDVPTAPQQL